jgi:putative SOS response-associated peptidase YedK
MGSLEKPRWRLDQDRLDPTTTPDAVTMTSGVPDRMPVIPDPENYDLRLDPGIQNVIAASELLKPYDARLMRCYPVSTRIAL